MVQDVKKMLAGGDMSKLVAHGKHKMWVEKNVVCIESQGPWNLEYFNDMHIELFNLVQSIKEEPYAVYIKLIGNAMPVAEGLNAHQKFVATGQSRALAMDLSECDTKPITEKVFKNAYYGAGIPCQVFESQAAAFDWLLPLLKKKD